jgi:L-ascorbate metabolism protein UlaG (beta-lactamase superfamily)
MDVPDIVHSTEATALGSSHSCQILAACGVSAARMREISAGDTFSLRSIEIEVMEARHSWAPGYTYGPLPSTLEPPLRARDYRMDSFFSFRIGVNGVRLLTDPGTRPEDAVPADLLFALPVLDEGFLDALLTRVRPKVVIPYHWEDFFRSLSRPLRPFLSRPTWSLPPIRRVNLGRFRHLVEYLTPETEVLEPEILRTYDLGDIL